MTVHNNVCKLKAQTPRQACCLQLTCEAAENHQGYSSNFSSFSWMHFSPKSHILIMTGSIHFKFVDSHPTVSQTKIVKHFKSLKSGVLISSYWPQNSYSRAPTTNWSAIFYWSWAYAISEISKHAIAFSLPCQPLTNEWGKGESSAFEGGDSSIIDHPSQIRSDSPSWNCYYKQRSYRGRWWWWWWWWWRRRSGPINHT